MDALDTLLMSAFDPFEPVANGRFGGVHFPASSGKIVAVQADPMRSLRFSGLLRRAPDVGFAAPVGGAIPSHSAIQWTQDPAGVAIEDVSIDLGRGDIPVSEQLLDGANVIAHLKQVMP